MAEPEKVEPPQSQPEPQSEPLPRLFPPGESQVETRGARPSEDLIRRIRIQVKREE
jgi:hypothetical protein